MHLNVSLETLFRGPVLSLFAVAKWAAMRRGKAEEERPEGDDVCVKGKGSSRRFQEGMNKQAFVWADGLACFIELVFGNVWSRM